MKILVLAPLFQWLLEKEKSEKKTIEMENQRKEKSEKRKTREKENKRKNQKKAEK